MYGILLVMCLINLAALILSIRAIVKANKIEEKLTRYHIDAAGKPAEKPAAKTSIDTLIEKIQSSSRKKQPLKDSASKTAPTAGQPEPGTVSAHETDKTPLSPKSVKPDNITAGKDVPNQPANTSMEQTIGTRWIPIAGIILLIFGAGFFLKFAYDNFTISPVFRVLLVAACGLAALIVGEITRRRQYEIVAKSVTALGFGLLYASVFAAYGFYRIIGPWPALTLGVTVTAFAMLYAVVLDEIIMAFLSLLGGYLTPILISTNQYLPAPLFSYLFVLAVGAMQCAYCRKWRAVNILSFSGTFLLYTMWFEKFYGTQLTNSPNPVEMPAALISLLIFFTIFLIVPLLNDLMNKTRAGKEDVLLILANAGVTFYYLYMILETNLYLAWSAVILSAAHLGMMFIVRLRSKEDVSLQGVLLAISLVFITLAMPLFFSMQILSIAWAGQATVVTLIGIRYRSRITQIGGLSALILSCANMFEYLPIYNSTFTPVFNPVFGTWCFVAGSAFVNHLIYRFASRKPHDTFGIISQCLYILASILLAAVSVTEWFNHCNVNIGNDSIYLFTKGLPVILAAILLLNIVYPVCPAGRIREGFAILTASAGTLCTILSLVFLHERTFGIFLNSQILTAYAFIAALAVYHLLYRFVYKSQDSVKKVIAEQVYAAIGVLILIAASMEWYWHCYWNIDTTAPVLTSIPFMKGLAVILPLAILLFVIRPLSLLGKTCRILSVLIGVIASVYLIGTFLFLYNSTFRIFLNTPFIIAIICIAAFAAAALLLRMKDRAGTSYPRLSAFFAISAIFMLWTILTQEIYIYWHCLDRYEADMPDWQFQAYMYISIMWAVYAAVLMVIGFVARLPLLRYIALGLFGLLLAKVFIIDTSQIENVYRITAFIATGVVLVSVSYLYQFLKKKNFFGTLTIAKTLNSNEDKLQ